jgi:hypothetical protein
MRELEHAPSVKVRKEIDPPEEAEDGIASSSGTFGAPEKEWWPQEIPEEQ